MFFNMKEKLINLFNEEKQNWILWIPVLFGVGIGIYFAMPIEPQIKYSITALIFSTVILIIAYVKKNNFIWLGIILIIISSGFLNANYRSISAWSPTIEKQTRILQIKGTITEINKKNHGAKVILDNLTLESFTTNDTPRKIRLNVNTELNNSSPGDIVELRVVLSPPPIPVIPDGYDFSRYAYFTNIGATGYAVSPITIIEKAKSNKLKQIIAKARYIIAQRITDALDKDPASIAKALIIGDRKSIRQQITDNMRDSGLAHLLAISGMHLALVATIFFITSRIVIACSEYLTLKFNTKKTASIMAIIGSFGYLLISGSPISAQRAFIMVSLILIASMIDRKNTPMRSIALAAMIILLFRPESLISASFQMSFSAVLALIASFEYLAPFTKKIAHYNPLKKLIIYIVGLIISSLVAAIATAPFSIYHFNHVSFFGILANLVAIPTTSLVIMPFGILSLFLMPFTIEPIALIPMSWGINFILDISYKISQMPYSSTNVPTMPIPSLILIIFGGLWLCIWRKIWRLYGIIIILAGISLSLFSQKPDIIIDGKSKIFAIRNKDQKFLFSNNMKGKFAKKIWLKRFGLEIADSDNNNIRCDFEACIYKKQNYIASIIKDPNALARDCKIADIIINLTSIPPDRTCRKNKKYISIFDIYKYGTHAIYLNENIKINHVAKARGNRIWTRD